jgi:hypothetical protein
MFVNMIGNCVIRSDRSCQNKRQFVLANRVARTILRSRFRAGIGEALKSESCLVKVRRLFGVADIKFNIIGAMQWQKILFRFRHPFGFWSSNCRWHNDLLTLSR